ncbi:hypothetical protein DL766_010156 [Monosporascus sp. MC13-8B]|nr:hypothetical protein DL766_010156 [Monosporascus sp. MC13-8B]
MKAITKAIATLPILESTTAHYGTTGVMSVAAGQRLSFRVEPSIQRPGPVAFYLAKAPDGEFIESFTGDGDVWFKISYDQPIFGTDILVWASESKTEVSVTIPSCIAPGQYLFRVGLVRGRETPACERICRPVAVLRAVDRIGRGTSPLQRLLKG